MRRSHSPDPHDHTDHTDDDGPPTKRRVPSGDADDGCADLVLPWCPPAVHVIGVSPDGTRAVITDAAAPSTIKLISTNTRRLHRRRLTCEHGHPLLRRDNMCVPVVVFAARGGAFVLQLSLEAMLFDADGRHVFTIDYSGMPMRTTCPLQCGLHLTEHTPGRVRDVLVAPPYAPGCGIDFETSCLGDVVFSPDGGTCAIALAGPGATPDRIVWVTGLHATDTPVVRIHDADAWLVSAANGGDAVTAYMHTLNAITYDTNGSVTARWPAPSSAPLSSAPTMAPSVHAHSADGDALVCARDGDTDAYTNVGRHIAVLERTTTTPAMRERTVLTVRPTDAVCAVAMSPCGRIVVAACVTPETHVYTNVYNANTGALGSTHRAHPIPDAPLPGTSACVAGGQDHLQSVHIHLFALGAGHPPSRVGMCLTLCWRSECADRDDRDQCARHRQRFLWTEQVVVALEAVAPPLLLPTPLRLAVHSCKVGAPVAVHAVSPTGDVVVWCDPYSSGAGFAHDDPTLVFTRLTRQEPGGRVRAHTVACTEVVVPAPVRVMVFAPDSAHVAVGTEIGVLLVAHDTTTGCVYQRAACATHDPVVAVCFAPDGQHLAACTLHGHVAVLRVGTGTSAAPAPRLGMVLGTALTARVCAAAWANDGTTLYVVHGDNIAPGVHISALHVDTAHQRCHRVATWHSHRTLGTEEQEHEPAGAGGVLRSPPAPTLVGDVVRSPLAPTLVGDVTMAADGDNTSAMHVLCAHTGTHLVVSLPADGAPQPEAQNTQGAALVVAVHQGVPHAVLFGGGRRALGVTRVADGDETHLVVYESVPLEPTGAGTALLSLSVPASGDTPQSVPLEPTGAGTALLASPLSPAGAGVAQTTAASPTLEWHPVRTHAMTCALVCPGDVTPSPTRGTVVCSANGKVAIAAGTRNDLIVIDLDGDGAPHTPGVAGVDDA